MPPSNGMSARDLLCPSAIPPLGTGLCEQLLNFLTKRPSHQPSSRSEVTFSSPSRRSPRSQLLSCLVQPPASASNYFLLLFSFLSCPSFVFLLPWRLCLPRHRLATMMSFFLRPTIEVLDRSPRRGRRPEQTSVPARSRLRELLM